MPNSISRKKLIRNLKKFGFEGPFHGSNNRFLIKEELKLRIPNPHSKDISIPSLREILKQAKISEDDWGSKK